MLDLREDNVPGVDVKLVLRVLVKERDVAVLGVVPGRLERRAAAVLGEALALGLVLGLLRRQREHAHLRLVLVVDLHFVAALLHLDDDARDERDVALCVAVQGRERLGAPLLRKRERDGSSHERLQKAPDGLDCGGGVPALLQAEVLLEDGGDDLDKVLGLERVRAVVRVLAPDRLRAAGDQLPVGLESELALDVSTLAAVRVREEFFHEPVAVGVAVDVDAEVAARGAAEGKVADADRRAEVVLRL